MPGELTATKVIIHPLVLLSVVDHYTRMSKIGNQKRVVGVLLGCWRQKGVLDVSNSFAGKFMISLIYFNSKIIFFPSCSSIRRRRKGQVSLVLGPRLLGVNVQYVQESKRS